MKLKTFGYNTAIFEDTDNTTEDSKYIDNVIRQQRQVSLSLTDMQ